MRELLRKLKSGTDRVSGRSSYPTYPSPPCSEGHSAFLKGPRTDGAYSYRSAFTGSATAARYACTLTVSTVTSRVMSKAAA